MRTDLGWRGAAAQRQERAITLTLTYPPSANRLWRNYRGVTCKSDEYKAWLSLNAGLCSAYWNRKLDGPYRLTILATPPDRRARDLDNLAKPCGDFLQSIGLVTNDKHMRELSMAWSDGPGAGVTCTVEPLL